MSILNFFLMFAKFITYLVGILFLFVAYRMFRAIKYQILLRDIKIISDINFIWPKVSLIIPVCNESATLEDAACSLFSMDYPNIEFIFVNDRSTDDTAKILLRLAVAESRMKIITISELPKSWLGKHHAFENGIRNATGSWILLSDADVHYNKTSLKKALSYAFEKKLDFLGVMPSVIGGSFFVRLILAQILHYLILMINFSKISDSRYPDALAHGAFMLMNKKSYEQSRGFEWLKMEVIDDMGLAFEMKRSGAKAGVLNGLDEIEFEWYSTVNGLIKGFEKNTFASVQYSRRILFFMCFSICLVFLGYTMFPVLTGDLLCACFVWVSLFLFLCMTALSLRKLICVPFLAIFLFPLTFPILPYIVLRSSLKCLKQNGIYWRGTHYPLVDLKKGQRVKIIKILSQ